MATQEVLTLIATAQDRASPALRQVQRAITDLNKAGVDLNKQSAALQNLNKAWAGLGETARKSRDDQKHIREYGQRFKELGEHGKRAAEIVGKDVVPIFSTLGITSVTATGAILGLVEATKQFAEQSNRLANFGRSYGYLTKDLQGFEGVARQFHVGTDVIMNSLATISREMDKVRGMPGMGGPDSLFNKLRMTPGAQGAAFDIQKIINTKDLSTAQQNIQVFMRLLREAKRIEEQSGPRGGAAYAGSFLEQYGIDRSNLRLTEEGLNGLEAALRRHQQLQGQLDPEKAKAYAKATAEMSSALTGLQNALGGELIGDLTKLTEQVTKFLEANNAKIGKGVADAIREISTAAKESLPDLSKIVDVLKFIQQLNAAHPGSAAQAGASAIREHGGQSVGDFLKRQAESPSYNAPTLPGVNWLREKAGLPHLAEGAQSVTAGGLAMLHAGEQVRPAKISGAYGEDDPEKRRVQEENTREVHELNQKLQRLIDDKIALAGGGGGGPGGGPGGGGGGPGGGGPGGGGGGPGGGGGGPGGGGPGGGGPGGGGGGPGGGGGGRSGTAGKSDSSTPGTPGGSGGGPHKFVPPPAAQSPPDSTPPPGATDSQTTAAIAADEWRKAGMSKAGVAGVLANIKEETGNFDPTLRHFDQPKYARNHPEDPEGAYAHGLYQEGAGEWNNYVAWLKQHGQEGNWKDPRLQSQFAAENLKKNYPEVWAQMQSGNTEQAAGAYASGYLKPASQYLQKRLRTFSQGLPGTEAYTGGKSAQSTPPADAKPPPRDFGGGFGGGSTAPAPPKGAVNPGLEALSKMNPPVQKFAEGGVVTEPTFGLLGEAGPEAVVPLTKFQPGMPPGPPSQASTGPSIRTRQAERESDPFITDPNMHFGSMQEKRENAVSLIEQHIGQYENNPHDAALLRQFMKTGGEGMNAIDQAWCAHTVNSALYQSGIKGSGSAEAKSFNDWAQRVDPHQAQRGDVVTLPGIPGVRTGHVGMVTGSAGSTSLPYVSGNTGKIGHVGQADLPFQGGSNRVLEVRRAVERTRIEHTRPGPEMAAVPPVASHEHGSHFTKEGLRQASSW